MNSTAVASDLQSQTPTTAVAFDLQSQRPTVAATSDLQSQTPTKSNKPSADNRGGRRMTINSTFDPQKATTWHQKHR